ncbi:arginine:ornithine antiporter [Brenneria sp. g21c3]|uniref:arginine:ornithine antiporter n=1 Tax=Brenneria sp. g21c3 TaxID=3093893 RepID=UPI002EB5CE56|nr:arginine:ornithine antiporter [Brenneria sp. g21c3]
MMGIKATPIFYFWGMMDLAYVVRFLWLNFSHQRIPIYDDTLAFLSNRPVLGVYGDLFFILSLCLTLSLPVSAWLFLRQRRCAITLAYLQTPVRLLTVTPSLSFIPWLIGIIGVQHALLNLGLLLCSEIAKVLSLRFIRVDRRKNAVS